MTVREDPAAFVQDRLGSEGWVRPFSVEEVTRLSDDGFFPDDERIELVDGKIEVMPADGHVHVHDLGRLADLLSEALARSGDNRFAVRIKASLKLGERHLREPDLMLLAPTPRTRLPEPRDVGLALEVCVSSRGRDFEAKRRDYAAAGISEYWVWDTEARALTIFQTPLDGDYRDRRALDSGAVAPLCAPGAAIDVAAVAAEP